MYYMRSSTCSFNFGVNTGIIAGACNFSLAIPSHHHPCIVLPLHHYTHLSLNCTYIHIAGVLVLLEASPFPELASAWWTGLFASAILAGAFLGSLACSLLADRLGRRRLLLLNNVFYIGGPVLLSTASSIAGLIASRLLTGLGVGVSNSLVNLYIAEIAPSHQRGGKEGLN
jgi:MFS family permease